MPALLYGLAALLLIGSSHVKPAQPTDEELALRLLRSYEAAVDAYDVKAAAALLTDDHQGWRGSGTEGVGQLIDRLKEEGTALELDLTQAEVKVEGNAARVSEVGNCMGQWRWKATYVLNRTLAGWRIKAVEVAR